MNSYSFEIEIFEGKGSDINKNDKNITPDFANEGICAWMYRGDGKDSFQKGKRFKFPEDMGQMCPWLTDSINTVVRVLAHGGILPWTYEGTNYKKEIDPEGVTTEFIRCIDPSDSGIVVKVIRTKIKSQS